MKKLLLGTLCGALALTLAVPAMADHTLGGYFRTQFMSVKGSAKDSHAQNFVDQRLRAKWTNSLNDYVTVVWYGEVDTVWGEKEGRLGGATGAKQGGGNFGADGINVETKHVYANIKVPDTSVNVRVGVQGVADIFESTYIDNDAAAVTVGAKFGAADVGFIWSKFQEGDSRVTEDDTDLYGATVGFAPSDAVKIGIGAYYADQNLGSGDDSENTLLTIGAKGSFAAGPAMIDVGLANQSSETAGVDGSAMLAYVKAAMTFGEVKTFARLLYISNDDSSTDNDSWTNLSGFEFYKDGLMIMGTDVRYNNGPGGRQAFSAAYAGYGLMGLTLGADMKIAGDYGLHLGAFYGQTLEDTTDENAATKVDGEDLGFEINCQLSKNVGEKANVALRGAYVAVGDYFGKDADDMYTASVVLNIGY